MFGLLGFELTIPIRRQKTSTEPPFYFAISNFVLFIQIYIMYSSFYSTVICQCNINTSVNLYLFLCEGLEIKIINSKHHNYSCSFKYFIIQSNCFSSNAFKCCYGIPSRLFKMVTLFLGLLFMKFIRDDIF